MGFSPFHLSYTTFLLSGVLHLGVTALAFMTFSFMICLCSLYNSPSIYGHYSGGFYLRYWTSSSILMLRVCFNILLWNTNSSLFICFFSSCSRRPFFIVLMSFYTILRSSILESMALSSFFLILSSFWSSSIYLSSKLLLGSSVSILIPCCRSNSYPETMPLN